VIGTGRVGGRRAEAVKVLAFDTVCSITRHSVKRGFRWAFMFALGMGTGYMGVVAGLDTDADMLDRRGIIQWA